MSPSKAISETPDEGVPEPAYHLFLTGQLVPGLRFREPLLVVVYQPGSGDPEFILSEHNFYNHTAGSTLPEALASFKQLLADVYMVLHQQRPRLHERMHTELKYFDYLLEATKGSEYDFS